MALILLIYKYVLYRIGREIDKKYEINYIYSMNEAYQKYLVSAHWIALRKRKLSLVNRCEICSRAIHLEVHHTHYKNLYKMQLNELKVLCRECHRKQHGFERDRTPKGNWSNQALASYRKEKLPFLGKLRKEDQNKYINPLSAYHE
jgi:hypothetical protein